MTPVERKDFRAPLADQLRRADEGNLANLFNLKEFRSICSDRLIRHRTEKGLGQPMLFAADTTVVAIGGLEELEPAIQRIWCDACAQGVHIRQGHGCEAE